MFDINQIVGVLGVGLTFVIGISFISREESGFKGYMKALILNTKFLIIICFILAIILFFVGMIAGKIIIF